MRHIISPRLKKTTLHTQTRGWWEGYRKIYFYNSKLPQHQSAVLVCGKEKYIRFSYICFFCVYWVFRGYSDAWHRFQGPVVWPVKFWDIEPKEFSVVFFCVTQFRPRSYENATYQLNVRILRNKICCLWRIWTHTSFSWYIGQNWRSVLQLHTTIPIFSEKCEVILGLYVFFCNWVFIINMMTPNLPHFMRMWSIILSEGSSWSALGRTRLGPKVSGLTKFLRWQK